MCCAFLFLVLAGPRIFGAFWWLFQPQRWERTFQNFIFAGSFWWVWAIAGLIFLPWMTLMFVIVGFDGIQGWDWLWLGLGLLADIMSYGGGAGRKRVPGYAGY